MNSCGRHRRLTSPDAAEHAPRVTGGQASTMRPARHEPLTLILCPWSASPSWLAWSSWTFWLASCHFLLREEYNMCENGQVVKPATALTLKALQKKHAHTHTQMNTHSHALPAARRLGPLWPESQGRWVSPDHLRVLFLAAKVLFSLHSSLNTSCCWPRNSQSPGPTEDCTPTSHQVARPPRQHLIRQRPPAAGERVSTAPPGERDHDHTAVPVSRRLPPPKRPFPLTPPATPGMSHTAFKTQLKPNTFSGNSCKAGTPPPTPREKGRKDWSHFLFLEHIKHCSVPALTVLASRSQCAPPSL